MENLLNLLRRMKFHLNIAINKIDEFYRVTSWEPPTASFINFLIVNCTLWILVYGKVPIIGSFFTICLVHFLTRNMSSVLQLSAQPIDYVEYCGKISSILSNISRYRRENPLEFCLTMSLFFLILAYISSIFSGPVVCFFTLWIVFFAPLIYKKLPPQIKRKLEEFLSSFEKFQDVIQEEDLIPLPIENNPEDNEDLESLGTDRTADSVTNSLISGISSMPSFLDAEDNHEILEEDLIPIPPQNHELAPSLGDSSDSESELKDIGLKESHFSRESSSDEEGKFEEGLLFEETQNQTLQESKGLVHNIVDYVTSTGGFQLSSLINNAMSSIQSTETKHISDKSSTSDEDFEIIDLEELKK